MSNCLPIKHDRHFGCVEGKVSLKTAYSENIPDA